METMYELAMIPLCGWSNPAKAIYPTGLHPVSKTCLLPILNEKVEGSKIFVTLQLWKKVNDKGIGFTAKDLSVVNSVKVSADSKSVVVKLLDGSTKVVKFE